MAVMDQEVPYPFMKSKDAMEHAVEQMLYRFREKGNAKLQAKIEEHYLARYGATMLPLGSVSPETMAFHGAPGQGKSSSLKGAASIVAKSLGMNLVINPVPPYTPQENDIVFVSLEMSGEISNIIVGGIPIDDVIEDKNGKKVRYMNKLPMYHLSILGGADASVLILDDFVNAHGSVQNTALSIALEGRFQMLDLGNCMVALTANLGSLDNSDVTPLASPMIARVSHYYVEDTPDDFIERMQSKYPDELGDAGISSYLDLRRDHFMFKTDSEEMAPQNGMLAPFPCSRTWEMLINKMRIYYNRATQGAGPDLNRIDDLARSVVGPAVASNFSAFAYANMTGAEPLCRALFETGKFDMEAFNQSYKEGLDAESQDFAYQVAYALSNHASARISRGESIEKVINNFSKALLCMDENVIALAASQFGSRMKAIGNKDYVEFDSVGNATRCTKNFNIAVIRQIAKTHIELSKTGQLPFDVDTSLDENIRHCIPENINSAIAYALNGGEKSHAQLDKAIKDMVGVGGPGI